MDIEQRQAMLADNHKATGWIINDTPPPAPLTPSQVHFRTTSKRVTCDKCKDTFDCACDEVTRYRVYMLDGHSVTILGVIPDLRAFFVEGASMSIVELVTYYALAASGGIPVAGVPLTGRAEILASLAAGYTSCEQDSSCVAPE